MDQSSGNASSSDAHFNGGDWSPRISFSHGFACAQRIPSPANRSALHDSEFEFSRSVGTDLLSADELFCNGKLRPLKLSSHEGSNGRITSQKKDEPHAAERGSRKGVLQVLSGDSSKEDCGSVCKEDFICGREQTTGCDAGDAKLPTSRAQPISACRRAEKAAIGKKPVNPASPTCRKVDLPSINRMAEKPDDGKPAAASRSYASREGVPCACNPDMGRKAGKSEPPTSRKEVISARKLELCNNAGKSRSPSCRGDSIPACKLETSRKTGKEVSRSSREDAMLACKRAEDSELKGKAGEAEVKTSREDLLSACGDSRTCAKGGVPVRWREERLWPKQEEQHSRRFSKNPRSASMVMEGSSMLDNHRRCVSLNNSRCPSPSRSLSLPATTPASPSASSSISGFSASSFSSSSSRYKSKIKEFFKLKKLALPKEETLPPATSSSSSTCRLPLSPRSLLALFKSKESTKAGSMRSSNSMHNIVPQEAQEHVCASTKGVYSGAHKENFAKGKDVNALSQSQINSSMINQELAIPCLALPISAKPHPNPSFPRHFPPSFASKAISSIETTSKCSAERSIGSKPQVHTRKSHSFSHEKVTSVDGPTMLVIDEGLWEEGNLKMSTNNALKLSTHCPTSKEGSQRLKKGNNVTLGGNSKGGHVRPKGLERPMPYTSSVRVTPVLNVPSCITPSLRKAKSSSKPKAFSFESLFAKRERAFI